MEIGGQEIEVADWRDDWAMTLMEKGVIVKLTISRWRAQTRLNYNELGITFNNEDHKEFMSKYITLGYESLLPPSVSTEITSIEKRARTCLNVYSFNTVWGKFVPFSSFAEWKRENDLLKEEFFELSKDIGLRYGDIVKEVKTEYEKMARDVWKRIYPGDKNPPTASFLENFTSKIIDKIPERDMVVASFKYDAVYFKVPLPSLIQEDIAKAEKIVLDRDKAVNETLIEMQTKQIIAEEYRVKKAELIDSFLTSTVTFLRHHVAELADHTYQVLLNTKYDMDMRHVNKIKKMIKSVRNLNFHNDNEIESILNGLLQEVSKYKGDRDKEKVQVKLRELVDLSKKEYMPEDFNPMIDMIDID
jgi:hypothetical protein